MLAVGKALGIITFPLLARHFSVAEYGALDFLVTLGTLASVAVVFGQDSAMVRFYYDSDDPVRRANAVSQALVMKLFQMLLVLPPIWIAAPWISAKMMGRPDLADALQWAVLQIPFAVIVNFVGNLLKWTFRRGAVFVMSIGIGIAQMTGIVVATVFLDADIRGIIMVGLVVNSTFSIIGLYLVRSHLTWPDGADRREMLVFAVPYGILGVAAALAPNIERGIALSNAGPNALGLYAAGLKVAALLSIPASAFQSAWGPFSYALHRQEGVGDTYDAVLRFWSVTLCVVALGVGISAEWLLITFASPKYVEAVGVVMPLTLGMAVISVESVSAIGIGLSKRSLLLLISQGSYLAMLLVAGPSLVKLFGIVGLAHAVLLAHLARTSVATWLATRVFPLVPRVRPVLLVFGVTIATSLTSSVLAYTHSASAIAVLWLGLLAVCVLAWTVVLSKTERKTAVMQFGLKRR
jgi:O-antigen/teichoic acid export membrane protein